MQYPNVSRDVTGPIWVTLYDDETPVIYAIPGSD